jgi:membrane complex biogenesis BtpA family protein
MNFDKKKIIGMIHVDALPGTPKFKGAFRATIKRAIKEAKIYADCGIDSIMLENMHDVPYLNRKVGDEIVAAMTILAYEVKNATDLPVGIQILAGANKSAIAAAYASGADYIRAEGFVFGHLADEGFFNSDAGELLRYRKRIGAENVKVFTDIKKKHSSHAVTSDVSIVETAKAAQFFLSDGVIVTGAATGEEANIEEIIAIKKAVSLPVLVGSGVTEKNVELYYEHADALIVGSYFKKGGKWENGVDKKRVLRLLKKIK